MKQPEMMEAITDFSEFKLKEKDQVVLQMVQRSRRQANSNYKSEEDRKDLI